MLNLQPIFKGNVRLFLEGNNPVLPFKSDTEKCRGFYIGSEKTNLVIRDYRSEDNPISQETQNEISDDHLLESFLRPSWAEIHYEEQEEHMEIVLSDSEADGELPVLWFGILEENSMPAYKVEWEVFKAITPNRTAFAALIP